MPTHKALRGWVAQTFQFALVSSGQDEVDVDALRCMVSEELKKLPEQMSVRQFVATIVVRARELLGPDEQPVHDAIAPGELEAVIVWVLTTVDIVHTALGKASHPEHVEAEADQKIVADIQGNRTVPTRNDLDLIVRKTIRWGVGELEARPA